MSSSTDDDGLRAAAASSSASIHTSSRKKKRKHKTASSNNRTQRRTIELKEIEHAPRTLALQYGICIPCRNQISRCDGHNNFTKACTQCRKRGDRCTWKLARYVYRGDTRKSGGNDRRKYAGETSSAGEEARSGREGSSSAVSVDDDEDDDDDDDNEEQQYPDDTAQSAHTALRNNASQDTETALRKAASIAGKVHLRFRFPLDDVEQKGHIKKEPIPSAGWPARPLPANSQLTTATKEGKKGKGKARGHSEEDAEADTQQRIPLQDEAGNEDVKPSISADDTATREYEAILSQLQSTGTGIELLETSTYISLLRSIFAEDSSNLAKSLYWWEFSEEANGGHVKGRWGDDGLGINLRNMRKKRFKKLSYLEKLLVENVHSWALWPRELDSKMPTTSGHNGPLDDDRFKSNLSDEILSATLSVLSDSTFPDEIINSMSPTHIKYWVQHKRDYGFPASLQRVRDWRHTPFYRSKYAIPASQPQDFTERHLNRDELILDIMENWGSGTVAIVQHALSSILLKIALFRDRKGPRRPLAPVGNVTLAELESDGTKPVKQKKNKDKGKEKEKEKVLSVAEITRMVISSDDEEEEGEQEDPSRRASSAVNSPAEPDMRADPDSTAEVVDKEQSEETGKKERKKKKKKTKAAQGPGDWQAVLLAAVTVPGLPRNALEATIKRLEALYGPSKINFMQRYDAIHATDLEESLTKDEPVYIPVPKVKKRHLRSSELGGEGASSKKRKMDIDDSRKDGDGQDEMGQASTTRPHEVERGVNAGQQGDMEMQVDPT